MSYRLLEIKEAWQLCGGQEMVLSGLGSFPIL